tara:strand:+ start:2258 stop:2527 length:270 start_codon:yes stop_codon:yes gene_type:complete
MKKVFKIILGLTQKVGASQALLKNGTKNLFVIGAVDGKGLITGQFTKPLMWPIWIANACRRLLNPTSFLTGVDYENDIDKNIPRNYDNG